MAEEPRLAAFSASASSVRQGRRYVMGVFFNVEEPPSQKKSPGPRQGCKWGPVDRAIEGSDS